LTKEEPADLVTIKAPPGAKVLCVPVGGLTEEETQMLLNKIDHVYERRDVRAAYERHGSYRDAAAALPGVTPRKVRYVMTGY